MRRIVLIVDDEPAIRFVYEEFLADRGVEVVSAEDGQGAIAAARDRAPGMALVDLNLPDMSGLAVIRELRQMYPRLPVIVISGTPRESCQAELERLGVDHFLEKPVDLLELAELLGRMVA